MPLGCPPISETSSLPSTSSPDPFRHCIIVCSGLWVIGRPSHKNANFICHLQWPEELIVCTIFFLCITYLRHTFYLPYSLHIFSVLSLLHSQIMNVNGTRTLSIQLLSSDSFSLKLHVCFICCSFRTAQLRFLSRLTFLNTLHISHLFCKSFQEQVLLISVIGKMEGGCGLVNTDSST